MPGRPADAAANRAADACPHYGSDGFALDTALRDSLGFADRRADGAAHGAAHGDAHARADDAAAHHGQAVVLAHDDADGAPDGTSDGASDGTADGAADGRADGGTDGFSDS